MQDFLRPLREDVNNSYLVLDRLDEKYEIFKDRFEREDTFNEIVNIAKNTRTDPTDLFNGLEGLMSTGYFKEPENAAAFDGALRSFMYKNNYSTEKMNANMLEVTELLQNGEFTLAKLKEVLEIKDGSSREGMLFEILNIDESKYKNDENISINGASLINGFVVNGSELTTGLDDVSIDSDRVKYLKSAYRSYENRIPEPDADQNFIKGTDEYNDWYVESIEKLNKFAGENVTFSVDEVGIPIVTVYNPDASTYFDVERTYDVNSSEFDKYVIRAQKNSNEVFGPTANPYDFEVNSVDHSGANYESDAMYGGVTEEGLPYISNEYFEKELEILEEINQNVRSINVGLGLGDVEDSYGALGSPIPLYSVHGDKIGITPDNVVGGGTPIPLLNPHGVQEVGYGGNSELSLPSLIEEMSVREEAEVVRSQEMYNMMVEIRDLLLKATLVRPNINVNVVNHINNQSDYTDFVNKLTSDLESAMSTTAVGNYGGYV